jgi:hypothetical protein
MLTEEVAVVCKEFSVARVLVNDGTDETQARGVARVVEGHNYFQQLKFAAKWGF